MDRITKLSEIYTPLDNHLVIEFRAPKQTSGGILLTDQAKETYTKEMCWPVVAVGPNVKTIKLGDYVLVGPNVRPLGIPLIYKAADDIQHIQIQEIDILGVVDKSFAQVTHTPIALA